MSHFESVTTGLDIGALTPIPETRAPMPLSLSSVIWRIHRICWYLCGKLTPRRCKSPTGRPILTRA